MSKPLISPECVHGEEFRCKQCLDWQRERRDAWVRFAATAFVSTTLSEAAKEADELLAEFDARFGKKEEQK